MRTTVDLPDDLYRRAKAEAVMRGLKFKDLIEEGLRRVLETTPDNSISKQEKPISLHDVMKDCCGIVKDAPADYASNPKYMEDFGK